MRQTSTYSSLYWLTYVVNSSISNHKLNQLIAVSHPIDLYRARVYPYITVPMRNLIFTRATPEASSCVTLLYLLISPLDWIRLWCCISWCGRLAIFFWGGPLHLLSFADKVMSYASDQVKGRVYPNSDGKLKFFGGAKTQL